jgi:hypothetical protein
MADGKREIVCVRLSALKIAILLCVVGAGAVCAQPAAQQRPPSEQGAACPPDVKGEPPTVGGGGGGNSPPLSDKLAESKGVICPPADVDREMQVKPPAGGELKVIPPPGSPGGDRSVEPR